MAYTKPLVTTDVYYHNGADAIVFADAISNGKTVRYGTDVRGQILHGDTVDSIDTDGNHVIIPYHAVVYAIVSVADSEAQTKPEDDFCN